MTKGQNWIQYTSVSLIFICVMAPFLYIADFGIERALHRYRMHQQIEAASLQTIVLDSATIQWKKKNRELLLNNEYFDVAHITYHRGKAYLRGVFDKRETAMHRAFTQAQKQPQNQGDSAKMVQWLLKQWIQPSLSNAMPVYGNPVAPSPIAKKAAMYNRGKQKPVYPPPQALSVV